MGNVITYASTAGVVVYDPITTNNTIRGNSIFGNGDLGIDLHPPSDTYPYVTPNHVGFASGPNNLQNFPVITNAIGSGGSTIVQGTLNSIAAQNVTIDIYRGLAADSTGYGEGQFYVGTVNVTTDGGGNARFALTNSSGNYSGQYVTATATDASGDTSEFNLAVLVTNQTMAAVQFTGPLAWYPAGFVFNLGLATNFNYRIQAATNLAANPVVWTDLTNFLATNSSFSFTDRAATNFRARFYRVISP